MQTENSTDTLLVFNPSSTQCCKTLWKSCIEHHTFFRLIAPPVMPTKSIFSLGSRYRYRYVLAFIAFVFNLLPQSSDCAMRFPIDSCELMVGFFLYFCHRSGICLLYRFLAPYTFRTTFWYVSLRFEMSFSSLRMLIDVLTYCIRLLCFLIILLI